MRRTIARLRDLDVKQAKPNENGKTRVLPDGDGLRLLIMPNARKHWQFRTASGGKETCLQVGTYPDMSLSKAREEASKLREVLRSGKSPVVERKIERARRSSARATTFKAVAEEMFKVKSMNVSTSYLAKLRGALVANIYPPLGELPIQSIDSPMLRQALLKIEKRGSLDMLGNVRRWAGEVFDFAKATGRFTGDNPAHALARNIFAQHEAGEMLALPWAEMPTFLTRLELMHAEFSTLCAVRLLTMTAVRPNEAAGALWGEFDLDAARWTIPAARMKKRKFHAVPLARQLVELLRELHEVSGQNDYLFPSRRGGNLPHLTTAGLLKAVRRAAGHANVHAHGMRAVFRTYAGESKLWEFEVMEAALHHGKDKVVGAYDRATHYEARIKLAQWYADELDALLNKRAPVLQEAA
ncbi:tyrosine-type recombinase/integrase [Uliginosibacterium flavum]|uniref:Integrase arm-type DNA-binding domain-containing protein n=1 Tax=Uliginosibacterium flavum TaxID=1396831 RepID=A0ABV2TPU3_9RHOO